MLTKHVTNVSDEGFCGQVRHQLNVGPRAEGIHSQQKVFAIDRTGGVKMHSLPRRLSARPRSYYTFRVRIKSLFTCLTYLDGVRDIEVNVGPPRNGACCGFAVILTYVRGMYKGWLILEIGAPGGRRRGCSTGDSWIPLSYRSSWSSTGGRRRLRSQASPAESNSLLGGEYGHAESQQLCPLMRASQGPWLPADVLQQGRFLPVGGSLEGG